jgi:hypothetical protein
MSETELKEIPESVEKLTDKAFNELVQLSIDEIKAEFQDHTYTQEQVFLVLDAYGESKKRKRGEVQRLFEDYKEVMESRARMDEKRRKLISRALKDYPITDLMLAIRGCVLTPWNMGTDPKNKTVYNSIELILRDSNHIERFRNTAIQKGVQFDEKIRKSDYDGSKRGKDTNLTEFSPRKQL